MVPLVCRRGLRRTRPPLTVAGRILAESQFVERQYEDPGSGRGLEVERWWAIVEGLVTRANPSSTESVCA